MNDRKARLDGLAVVLVMTCCALWGLNQVAAKVALNEIPPLMQASARSLGAALLLWLWATARGIKLWQRDGTAAAGIAAGLIFAVEFGMIFVGLQYTAASRMIVFLYVAPFVVALGMPFIVPSERLDRLQLLGLSVAFGGVVWAFYEGFVQPLHGELQWLGDALALGASVLWGATTLLLRASRLSTAPPEKTLLYQLAVSAVALGLASWVAGEPWPEKVGALSMWSLGFQTVIVTFASYLIWFWLLRHYPATRVSAFTLLTPVFGLLAGVILLSEPVTLRLVVALAAVAAGIALVNRRPAAPPAASLASPPPKETP